MKILVTITIILAALSLSLLFVGRELLIVGVLWGLLIDCIAALLFMKSLSSYGSGASKALFRYATHAAIRFCIVLIVFSVSLLVFRVNSLGILVGSTAGLIIFTVIGVAQFIKFTKTAG